MSGAFCCESWGCAVCCWLMESGALEAILRAEMGVNVVLRGMVARAFVLDTWARKCNEQVSFVNDFIDVQVRFGRYGVGRADVTASQKLLLPF